MLNHMVAFAPEALDAAFQALAHPTRRAMIRALSEGERTVGELAEPFEVSLAASSKHIQVLERAGLVTRRVEGRVHTCRLEPAPLQAVAEWTADYRAMWEQQFARLDEVLAEMQPESPTKPRRIRRKKS